jgi:integrase
MKKEMTQAVRAELTNAIRTRYRSAVGKEKRTVLGALTPSVFPNSATGNILHEATRHAVDQLLESNGAATANRYVAFLRALLRLAEREWGWIDRAPHLRMRSEPKRRVRWITPQEAAALIAAIPVPHRNPMRFAPATGLRMRNVLRLEWRQVDGERCLAWIHPDHAKARRAIPVPLNDDARAVLKEQEGRHATLAFAGRRRPDSRVWQKALTRAGIEDFRWHDLRHTWASWHAQSGTPMREMGGWETAEMVRRYAHLGAEHLAEHAARISGRVTFLSQPSDSCGTIAAH